MKEKTSKICNLQKRGAERGAEPGAEPGAERGAPAAAAAAAEWRLNERVRQSEILHMQPKRSSGIPSSPGQHHR